MSSGGMNFVKGAVAVLALGGAVFFYIRSQDSSRNLSATEFTVRGVCLACKKDVEAKAKMTEGEPHACPNCKQEAVFNWWFCNACQKRIVPALMKRDDGSYGVAPFAKCPECSGTDIVGFDAGMHQPKGDGKLPKWPP